MQKILVIIAIAAAVIAAGFFALNSYIYNEKQATPEDPSISSYEECIEAGYPSLESYPEQCETPSGKRFVRNLPEEALAEIMTPITVRGTIICLPHWDTSGPHTLECAFGFQDESGRYYVLRDADPSEPVVTTAPTHTEVTITGTLIPGSHERYQSVGTIEVEEIY